jgi:DNA helicase-2/ATP-dependent DNA helicase PcrA
VEVSEPASYGGYGPGGIGRLRRSRFDTMEPFNSAYRTPGWQRRQANRDTPTRASARSASRSPSKAS